MCRPITRSLPLIRTPCPRAGRSGPPGAAAVKRLAKTIINIGFNLTEPLHSGSLSRVAIAIMMGLLSGIVETAMAQPGRHELIASIKTECSGAPIQFSPDGKTLFVISGESGGLMLWDVATKKPRAFFGKVGILCTHMDFSPDGKSLAMIDATGLSQFDPIAQTSRVLVRPEDLFEGPPPSPVAFSPNGKLLATSDFPGKVKIWDAGSGKKTATMVGEGAILDLAFFPDGKTIAGAASGIYLWDVDGKQKPRVWKGYKFSVRCLAISPDGKTLATPGDSNEVWLWDVEKQRIRDKWKVDYKLIETVAFSRDGRILVAAGGNGNLTGLSLNPGLVTIWDANTGKQVSRFKVLEDTVGKVALSPDGKLIAVSAVASLRKVNVWDISAVLPNGGRPNNR